MASQGNHYCMTTMRLRKGKVRRVASRVATCAAGLDFGPSIVTIVSHQCRQHMAE